jgi:hypothetical protein
MAEIGHGLLHIYSKAAPLDAVEALVGRGGIGSSHSWPRHYMAEWLASRPRKLHPGEKTFPPQYPSGRRLGGPQRRAGHKG